MENERKRTIEDIENESGERFEDVISEFYDSCIRARHYDLRENASYFISENNLYPSEYRRVVEALNTAEENETQIATVQSISYSVLTHELCVSLSGRDYLWYIKPENIRFGGKNCEIGNLCVGGKILVKVQRRHFSPHRDLGIVTLISDGVREVDKRGNMLKW